MSDFHKPPIFCQKCHKQSDAIINCYLSKEAKIMFAFVCPKCGGDFQTFIMDFAQVVAYCLCREKGLAGYQDGNETIH